MDIERLVNESGFIPTENMAKWRESLTDEQRQALDNEMQRLFDDVGRDNLEAF